MEFALLRGIQELHNPWLDQVMQAITWLGNGGWFWCALAVLFLAFRRTRRTGLSMLASLGLGALIGLVILKPLIGRERPCWIDPSVRLLIPVPQDFSFPSGHTSSSFAAAVTILLNRKKGKVPVLGLAALVLAVLIGFSRMYLYVHFPTDVLAGALLGTGSALAVNRILRRMERWGKFPLHLLYNSINMQSRRMRVKCRLNRELSARRKETAGGGFLRCVCRIPLQQG